MKSKQSSDATSWYKNAVIYGLDVETFFDTDGDGIGDFKGAAAKFSYLSWLGIDCIWLLPFYPTSNRDNGYDVISYTNIDQRLGTLEDFRSFVEEAKRHGIRILIDLVLHHTSDEHPWFMAATTDPSSHYRDYYIWTKQLPPKPHDTNIFPTKEKGVWHYDEYAKAYYHHKFYHFEPDLNIANPKVQNEMYKIIDFWLSFDIDGFRIDAATHMFDSKGLQGTEIKNPDTFIEKLRSFITERKPEAILLGEADVEPKKIKTYLGENDRFHLLFNFLLDNSLFLTLARKSADPITWRLKQLSDISSHGQWANFVRNLDELDLEQLTETERDEVYKAFAPDPNMRVYNRGIRRRTAPMVGGDILWLKMLYSLLFSLPGTPLFVYGDEIGMGDDLSLPERVSVRTPMQWNGEENAGFSFAEKDALVRDVITEGNFSFKKVNVKEQRKDTTSLLHFFKDLIALRKELPEIGSEKYEILDTNNDTVLALMFHNNKRDILILHNVSDDETSVSFKGIQLDTCQQFFGDAKYSKDTNEFILHGFGYRWFEITHAS